MAWARLDDSFYDHPKVTEVWEKRPDALGLHMKAIAFCSRHETNGYLSVGSVKALSPLQSDREQQVKALLDEGLWFLEDGKYGIHDYLDYNFSKEEIAEKREQDRKRKAKAKERQ